MMSVITEYYDFLFGQLPDSRVKDWPLMSSPFVLLGIIFAYLYVIYRVLPFYMTDRKPYSLKTVITVYNVFQVISCTIIIYGIATSGWTTRYSLGCQLGDFSEDKLAVRLASYVWWTMVLKLVELIETPFFVLRKKYNQVSPLHVYHHVSTLTIAWICVKYYASGMLTFSIMLNSFVHILMYTYYLLSALGPEMQKMIQPLKSKLTIIQMVQLSILFLHTAQVLLPSCPVPNVGAYIFMPSILINLGFFVKFYLRTYTKKKIR